MVQENEALKLLFLEHFPGLTQYTNDVPKGFKRPCIEYFDPEDKVDTKEMTKLSYLQTKSLVFFVFYENDREKDSAAQGEAMKSAVEQIIMAQKKVPLPKGEGRQRYISIEGYSSTVNQTDCRVECNLQVSRVLPREMPA